MAAVEGAVVFMHRTRLLHDVVVAALASLVLLNIEAPTTSLKKHRQLSAARKAKGEPQSATSANLMQAYH